MENFLKNNLVKEVGILHLRRKIDNLVHVMIVLMKFLL